MKKTVWLGCAALTAIYSGMVCADNAKNWETFSDIGTYSLVGLALAVPAYQSDWQGFTQAGLSLATASGVGLVAKSLIDEERPDGSGNDSFPSNHTANAFAAATTLNIRYGWEIGLPAYGMAALSGLGRVEGNKHYWRDVLAGAVLGTVSAWIFTESFDDSVQVLPWIEGDQAGISVTMRW
ncbi:phosphatase PAP2 family protein [Vibrio metoecus]|uniref:phosphatase PAP2 family protein n=1 Tax=Vibrio metoecus TaxID=1481663 RepID=UPI0012ADF8F2|nr:phosphatase PAP2 family protein [Vibrio metoecus]